MNPDRPLTPAQQQFGNQNAKGCTTSGRPRTTSLPPDQMIELGKEMVEWVRANDPFHLSEWYSIEKMFLESEWNAMSRMPEFLPYYEQALKLVGRKYLNGDVNPTISSRWQRVYFRDLRCSEDEDARAELERKKELAEHDHKLKADSQLAVPEEVLQRFESFAGLISRAQSERKIAANNTSAEEKS